MGACVSKCYSIPPPNTDPSLLEEPTMDTHLGLPEEKLVISKSPPPTNTISSDLSKSDISSCSSSSAAVSSLTSSSSPSPSNSSALSLSTSSSTKPLPSSKVNSDVVVLDPKKRGPTKPKPVGRQSQRPAPASRTPGGPSIQPFTRSNQSSPAKRTRSSSPTIRTAGRKSSRNENSSSMNSSSTSTFRRSRSVEIHRQRRQVSAPRSAIPHQTNARRENVKPSSPQGSSSRPSSSFGRETSVHHIHDVHHQAKIACSAKNTDASSRQSSTSPLMEDLNNPLISMDCFIFL